MSPLPPNGVPDLGAQRQGIIVTEHRLIPANALDIMPGGLMDQRAEYHARVIDLARAVAYYVPLNTQQIDQIRRVVA